MMLLDAPRVLYQAAGLGAHARFVVDERPALWSEYRMARRLLLAVALLLATPSAWADPDVWVHDIDARLGTLDVATGDYAEVGITLFGTIDVPLSDIAFAPGGELYGISYETQSFVGSVLYTIDTTTAVLTRIAQSNVGHPLNALVFRNDGTLLAAGGSDLVSLDTATAASTPILSFAPHFSAGDLAFDASGDLYLTVVSGSGALYALRGVAVLAFVSGGVSMFSYVAFAVLLVLVPPVILGTAALIGVGDTWLDLRARVAAKTV
jgi:hypothetical protein